MDFYLDLPKKFIFIFIFFDINKFLSIHFFIINQKYKILFIFIFRALFLYQLAFIWSYNFSLSIKFFEIMLFFNLYNKIDYLKVLVRDLAYWFEHWPFKPKVVSSILAIPWFFTKNKIRYYYILNNIKKK